MEQESESGKRHEDPYHLKPLHIFEGFLDNALIKLEVNAGGGIRTHELLRDRSLGPLRIDLKGFNKWLEEKDCSPVHKDSIRRYIIKMPPSFSSPLELSNFLKRASPSRHYVIATANYLMYLADNGENYHSYRNVLKFEKTKPDLNIPSDHKVRDMINRLHEPYRTFGTGEEPIDREGE